MSKRLFGIIAPLLLSLYSVVYALPKSIPSGVANSLSSAAKGEDVNIAIPITGIYIFVGIILLAIVALVLAIYQKLHQVRR